MAFKQAFPGSITEDEAQVAYYLAHAGRLEQNTPEDAKIYLICRGDNGDFAAHEQFYCSPRQIAWGSIGPKMRENDIYSVEKTNAELQETLEGFEYLYFVELDDAFCERYGDIFSSPEYLKSSALCRIRRTRPVIDLELIWDDTMLH